MINERVDGFRAPELERQNALLTRDHCDRIIDQAKLYSPTSPGVEGQPAIWRFPREETPRLVEAALLEYARRFGIKHENVQLPVRVLRYSGASQTRWHQDYKSESPRKVTCVVQLSSPNDFDGGVQFALGDGVTAATKGGRGDAFLFPGYFPHRVTVESGERWALAVWLSGEWQ